MFLVEGSHGIQRESTYAQEGQANSIQKGPSCDSNQEPSCCEARVLTTLKPSICHESAICNTFINTQFSVLIMLINV